MLHHSNSNSFMMSFKQLIKSGAIISRIINTNYISKRFNSHAHIEYDIVPLCSKDTDAVIRFLDTYYYPDEPLAKSLGGTVSDAEKKETINQIENGLSRKAVERKTNKIIGVTLNEIYTREMSDNLGYKIERLKKINDIYWHTLVLFKKLDEESRFWEKIGVNSCLRNSAICCDTNYRKMKIASRLLESVKSVSNEKFLKGESTNDISYNILLRQGWKNIYEINFQDYRDENGKVIFNTQYPNTHLRLLIYKV